TNTHAELCRLIAEAISPDAPFVLNEGGLIKAGYDSELDNMREMASNSRNWIASLEKQERESTGIKNLKIGFNKVFGYYIEVTKSYLDQVPYGYIRKQTLANCERFVTAELKETEEKLLGIEEKIIKHEYQLFCLIRSRIKEEIPLLLTTANALAELDAYASLAQVADEYSYCRPEMTCDGRINIKDGRHPVVEKSFSDVSFVPNDTLIDNDQNRLVIITGPNMAGKSTYMRQVALITLLAHIGSFVPAKSAQITLTDRIFTRVGASDDLSAGQSTFMVEMTEVANILHNATPDSLLIFDEIGRGTSTFDGLSIAWAVVEYVAQKSNIGAKTLFATHYHELSELEGRTEGIKNYCIAVKEHGDDIIFLRKIRRGSADKSFGIQVARLAGLPDVVINRAREILKRLEEADINNKSLSENIFDTVTGEKNDLQQISLFDFGKNTIIEELKNSDIDHMSPVQAMNYLYELKERAKRV
ncbi:MAG TPA: DNA mismatch repair protein MutS, partial [Clostridia bacterium]|nr:DNA mismatch repair protein MutS [Clostridia bacterium]